MEVFGESTSRKHAPWTSKSQQDDLRSLLSVSGIFHDKYMHLGGFHSGVKRGVQSINTDSEFSLFVR